MTERGRILESLKATLRQTQMDRIKAHNLGKHGNG